MRIPYLVMSLLPVVILGWWVYGEADATGVAVENKKALETRISHNRETLSRLNAEWAYLNRPARLEPLVEEHFEELHLVPITSKAYGSIDRVAFKVGTIPQFDEVSGLVVAVPKITEVNQ